MVTRPVTWLFSWDLMLRIPICSWDMNLSSCSLPPGPGLGSHVHPLCPLQQLQPGPALAKAPLPIASCGELDAVSSKSVPYIFYLRVEGEQGQGMNQEGMCVLHPRLTRVFLELALCAERFISSLSWWEQPTTIFPCLWEPLHLIIPFH